MYEDFNTPNKSREIWHDKQEVWRAAIAVAIKKYCIMEEFEIVGVGVVRKYEHSDTVAFHRCALFVFVYVWGCVVVLAFSSNDPIAKISRGKIPPAVLYLLYASAGEPRGCMLVWGGYSAKWG